MKPSEIIRRVLYAIDCAEISPSPEQFTEARRLLNNELQQAMDDFVAERVRALQEDRRGNDQQRSSE